MEDFGLKEDMEATPVRGFDRKIKDTMRLAMLDFGEKLSRGEVRISAADFVRIAELYNRLREQDRQNPENLILDALEAAIERTIPDAEQRRRFISTFREAIKDLGGADKS